MRIRFLGVRGSCPVSGKNFRKYGGNTTAILINSGDTSLIIDAGTGITNLEERENFRENVVFLFTHYHLDHILGLPFAFLLYTEGYRRKMYGPDFGKFSMNDALDLLSNPRLLPFKVSRKMLETQILALRKELTEGDFRILSLYSKNHPLDGIILYRIEYQGKSVGIATDYELGDDREKVVEFFKGVDLLVHDAQYTPEEYEEKRGYGHSTEIMAAEVARDSGAGKLLLFHFDPFHRDEVVDQQEERAREIFPQALAAKEGLELEV